MILSITATSLSAQSPADTLISVGDYRLHVRVYRGDGATILLESGGGLGASQWDAVAPGLVRETGATVVTYDRAGFGLSDLPETPYHVRSEIAGIWRALEALKLKDSLVLVGHSYGGLLIQVIAHEHPNSVLGAVFVEPNLVGFIDAVGGLEGLAAVIALLGPGPPPSLTADRQTAALPATVETVRASALDPSVPVRVITSGRAGWPTEEANRAFRAAHEQLTHAAVDGELFVAEESEHMVTDTQPELIVQVVRDLLRSISSHE